VDLLPNESVATPRSQTASIIETPVSLLIADDKDIVRRAIRNTIGLDTGIKIIGEAVDFNEALELMSELGPDVIVLDLHMPATTDFSPTDVRRAATASGTKVIAMSIWEDEPSRALAATMGSYCLLDKANLGNLLVPAVRQLADL
jgi:DNA-binding NarL/FixJ family response regulator